ncbi:MAG: trimethylamine methyltransferase family protein [Rhodospirillaceae bacterium]|nr:trimethylamine methyltransferase family protein [Rhodospirillaceae bacterium]
MANEGRRGRNGRTGGRQGGGRAEKRAARAAAPTATAPYIVRGVPTADVLSPEGIEIIEANAETILAEIGIDFTGDDEVLALWRDAGADVSGNRVRLPRGLARKLIATAPAEFTQHARNPERSVQIGGNNMVIGPVYGPPFVHDMEGGRRYATIQDFENFVKLAYLSPHLHHSGGTVCEPVDVPVPKRHLDMNYAHMRLSDKAFMGSVTHPDRAADTIAMAEILFGDGFLNDNTVIMSLINVNSPMTFDATMLGALKNYVAANQAVIVTPFIMSGAMAPVSGAGTLAQAMAEGMAGAALTQLIRPGAPVVFGLFAAALSMQTGAPTFGMPEPIQIMLAAAQMVRRLGLPFRSGGSLTASKIADAQAAYESAHTLWPAVMGGVNFILHGAGWLEGGLVSSYEKFVMDEDQCGMMAVLARGVDLSEEAQAMDAIREIGPGKHFLGSAHTQRNFETAFYRSSVADNNSFEQWSADGSSDAMARANRLWKERLAAYEAPAIDPAIDDALKSFVAKRKAELPDSEY